MDNEKFTFVDGNHGDKTITIDKENDFKLVQDNKFISDEKIKTKPTTFFKDAIKRFSKNKFSVVAAVILGILILLAFVLPITIPYNVDTVHPYESYLPPKAFESGTGWWDGTKKMTGIVYNPIDGYPAGYDVRGVVDGTMVVDPVGQDFTDATSAYASGGYVRYSISKRDPLVNDNGVLTSPSYMYDVSNQYDVSINVGDIPASFTYGTQAEYEILLSFRPIGSAEDADATTVVLKDFSTETGTFSFDITKALKDNGVTEALSIYSIDPSLKFVIKPTSEYTTNLLLKSITFTSSNSSDSEDMTNLSFTDANKMLLGNSDAGDYKWSEDENSQLNLYHADVQYCSFTYDKYEVVYGLQASTVTGIDVDRYVANGWMKLDTATYIASERTASDKQALIDSFEMLSDECPLRSVTDSRYLSYTDDTGTLVSSFTISGTVSKYRYYGYSSMPKFWMGTDVNGKDMVKYTFSGLKTSLLLGLITFIICFIFGLLWGSISGYFGGWTDLLMERVTDILSGLPWIVVMTLCIIHLGSNFQTFALALCLTGWIGTSAITRTQFYRFKDREYILAARTLGASDIRLIFRHILPNAVGTIITSSVLMIPSVIFSEATISYLGLGLKNLSSLGVILSTNQIEIQSDVHLIVFPSVIMALIMISFNLFGNGLRDAFNPSLKGQD